MSGDIGVEEELGGQRSLIGSIISIRVKKISRKVGFSGVTEVMEWVEDRNPYWNDKGNRMWRYQAVQRYNE